MPSLAATVNRFSVKHLVRFLERRRKNGGIDDGSGFLSVYCIWYTAALTAEPQSEDEQNRLFPPSSGKIESCLWFNLNKK